MPLEYSMEKGKEYDDMIGYAIVDATTLLYPNDLLMLYALCTVYGFLISSFHFSIYSIDTLLYLYALPFIQSLLTPLKSLPKCNLSSSLRL